MLIDKMAQAGDNITELKTIVDSLNAHPFRMNLTLVGFSNKSSTELLQIVNDVFTDLDPAQKYGAVLCCAALCRLPLCAVRCAAVLYVLYRFDHSSTDCGVVWCCDGAQTRRTG